MSDLWRISKLYMLFSDCSMSKSDWNCSGKVNGKAIFTIPSMLYAEQWLPRGVHILSIGSRDCVILQGRGERGRPRVSMIYRVSGWAKVVTRVLPGAGGSEKSECQRNVIWRCDVTCLAVAGFEDGSTHEPGNAGSPQHWKRQENILS